jgi:glutaminyl-peptide cyclotransferase
MSKAHGVHHVGRRRRFTLALAVGLLTLCGCSRVEFDGRSAFRMLERQCAFGPRYPGSPGHEEMLEWLVRASRERGDHVAVQRFAVVSDGEELRLTNVIVSFRPEARERVLFGAHWDTRAVAEEDPDPGNREKPILGANDGASGVAVLLELASVMAERPPRVGVDLVFFDGEDGGEEGGLGDWCLGSSYYAAHLGDYCPRYAVVIDMIGDRDLVITREPNSVASSPDIVELVWGAARRVGALSFDEATGRAMYDDHVPLIRAGIPTALVIDSRYAHWHTLEDTPDKCSPESLEEVGRVLAELVY